MIGRSDRDAHGIFDVSFRSLSQGLTDLIWSDRITDRMRPWYNSGLEPFNLTTNV